LNHTAQAPARSGAECTEQDARSLSASPPKPRQRFSRSRATHRHAPCCRAPDSGSESASGRRSTRRKLANAGAKRPQCIRRCTLTSGFQRAAGRCACSFGNGYCTGGGRLCSEAAGPAGAGHSAHSQARGCWSFCPQPSARLLANYGRRVAGTGAVPRGRGQAARGRNAVVRYSTSVLGAGDGLARRRRRPPRAPTLSTY
jgi:hypothetical protein